MGAWRSPIPTEEPCGGIVLGEAGPGKVRYTITVYADREFDQAMVLKAHPIIASLYQDYERRREGKPPKKKPCGCGDS